ncbi:DNA-binding NtrC family response regulator [Dysgonomonas sp. PFB1-18]|uniref:sigma-54-dependent transcriptional regulator n=1 Tax=unclassified Dysgonomonas TaxID=2630389 RepID=UPI002475D8C4|nr:MULTISPECIES: sigma-54 dependent transcriptional regulator [unclassified Dysgonomonas]MDH6308331.1 DNA-binding NtrC family response regulator [Dysgonomonas sp. PF1-14]MDH6338232.1 DNA-binding NtrC family response regulator [Dysgonomonas sp. PF1-16]MDH6379729.1 DNA-binding NtrC family response regulator [Dysgonomonas sp. PFB1-18]MDH6397182.1 DNA-binding NtrC family response regulator [Dysgonomonas sp. PF1-23]
MAKPDIQQVKQRFGIIGNSPDLNRAIDIALQVAPTDMSVLVTGESGVGKENFPQIIHQFSHRKHGTYIAVNCGSIPEGTIDSELFGHEKGSFTGATGERKGYFEVANGGTLFLDEVGELPLSTQARLLRVLETGEFIKVGSSKVEKTDVRVVAATNLDMITATRNGRFREDLYYRLNTVPIRIPALRERKDDIPLLFRKFASDCAEKYSMPPITLTDAARQMLKDYYWPGNIRQLKNITEQISIIEQAREITHDILKLYLPANEVGLVPVGTINANDQKSFSNEREILYQVLFDMKKDMNELKKIVHDIVAGNLKAADITTPVVDSKERVLTPMVVSSGEKVTPIPVREDIHAVMPKTDIADADIIEAPDYEEETLSLQDVEKDMIIKALERHNGKRKNAAQDLKISERTLYRKIKEYNLEDL